MFRLPLLDDSPAPLARAAEADPPARAHRFRTRDYFGYGAKLATRMLASRVLSRHRPLLVNIEPTHRCNLDCVYCDKVDAKSPQMETGAALRMATASGAAVEAVFDWRQTGPQTWDIAVETANGSLLLSEGGNMLRLDGEIQLKAPDQEYPAMYRRFVDLVAQRAIDADIAPLRLVADAFLCGRHCPTTAFED